MIEYRRARLSDAPAIGLLHAANFRENNRGDFPGEFLETQLPDELLELWQDRLDRAPATLNVTVALADAELLGFICVFGAHSPEWGSLIDNLHVVFSRRTTGVGSSLMGHAGGWLASHHSDTAVYLMVLESNSVARQFYEKRGADYIETVPTETHGGAIVRNCRYTWPGPHRMSLS